MSSASSTLLNSSPNSAASSHFTLGSASASSGPRPQNLSPVVWKLAIFTLLMIVGPIGTYFVTLNYYFRDPTPSAITAAVVANLVLAGFVVVAFLEDSDPDAAPSGVSSGGAGGTLGHGGVDEFTREKIRAGKKE
ncbi:hypothetical protein JCM10212_005582 [Sporobolomyces blumeae]